MNSKIKAPKIKGFEVVAERWMTVNPDHPKYHHLTYDSKRVCDANWGRAHTVEAYLIRRIKRGK